MYDSTIVFSEWLSTGIMVRFEGGVSILFQRNISTTNEKFSRTRYSRLTKNPAPEGGFDGYLIKRKVASGALF